MSVTILEGDVISTLKGVEAGSVQTAVTSPPYYGLRSYLKKSDPLKKFEIGNERTPEEYVDKLVKVFREVWRVLADDGTLWVNLGDSYWGGNGKSGTMKPKDLLGIPWMVAFALRADGWYLRQDIIWNKPNPMPESVKDRCTKSHEYIFLLTKSRQYYYDYEAVLEEATGYDGRKDTKFKGSDKYKASGQTFQARGRERWRYKNLQEGNREKPHSLHETRAATGEEYLSPVRNKRSVWTVTTRPYKAAHFAAFPPELIEPCILAGSRPGDTVLDPFGGSGTTAAVALSHNRNALLCELNKEYIPLIHDRIKEVQTVMIP